MKSRKNIKWEKIVMVVTALLFLALLTMPVIATDVKETNRIVIGFKWGEGANAVTQEFAEGILKDAGIDCKVIDVDSKLNFIVIETKEDVKTIKTKLKKYPDVEFVEPDYIVEALETADYVPNDPYLKYQWGIYNINATKAWDIEKGKKSVVVAIVDTGVDYKHPDIAANYKPGGYDFVNNDPDPMDDHYHGTHCAGIVAAVMNNAKGIAGVAQVSIMAEKVLSKYGWGYSTWVAKGIEHAADHGAKIISMSLGSRSPSSVVERACQYAWNKGCLLVAAAGNDNGPVGYPAAYPTVIAVGAIDKYNKRAWFSNYGPELELMAPGVDVYSTVPGGKYRYLSGTSMACPHVSGVAALV
jgi:thermitase